MDWKSMWAADAQVMELTTITNHQINKGSIIPSQCSF
jgi:hypothetical protein